MSVKEIIEELQRLGYEVSSRKRKDGGYIITKINGQTFKGASGNKAARSMLGIELSSARAEQLSFNVQKYIQGTKKKATLDEEMKKDLRKVQRIWRKNKVKARITAKKVKEHIKQEGREAAKEYLQRQARYGEGYAYLENVYYLAQYIEDIGKGILSNDQLQNEVYALAEYIRSKANTFKEEWIEKCYQFAYFMIENHFDPDMVRFCIKKIYETIG